MSELMLKENGRGEYPANQLMQELTQVYKDIPVGLCFFDCNMRFLLINDWLAALNGMPADDHLGRRISELLPDIAAGVESQLRSVIATGEPIIGGTVDAETPAHRGLIRTFQHNYFPVESDDGTVVGVSCVVEDITDRRRMEAALQAQRDALMRKNAELEAYDHTIAHSLKTPLSASIRFLQILSNFKAGNLSEEQQHLLMQALSSLENTGDIVDALLMLSTVSNVQVESKPLDMERLVEEVLRQLAVQRSSAQATVQMPDTWLPAVGHAPWVGEVWLNYLSNAFRYCRPPVQLELGSSMDGPDSVRYWVRDNGTPLTKKQQERLFVPFSRLHHDQADGHGLGLAIVRRAVAKLGGTAGVDTPDSGGNRFFFTLPIVRDLSLK